METTTCLFLYLNSQELIYSATFHLEAFIILTKIVNLAEFLGLFTEGLAFLLLTWKLTKILYFKYNNKLYAEDLYTNSAKFLGEQILRFIC